MSSHIPSCPRPPPQPGISPRTFQVEVISTDRNHRSLGGELCFPQSLTVPIHASGTCLMAPRTKEPSLEPMSVGLRRHPPIRSHCLRSSSTPLGLLERHSATL